MLPHSSQACGRKLYNYLKVAPYRPDQQAEEEEEDEELVAEAQGKGMRVLGLAFSSSRWCLFRFQLKFVGIGSPVFIQQH